MQVGGGLRHLGRLLFAREPLELPRRLFRFLGELALRAATRGAAARTTLRALALAREFLLLARGESLEPLGHLVEPACALLLTALFDLIILVAELVGFEFEQVGQVRRLGRGPTTAARIRLAHADLHLAEGGFGLLEPLEGALLRREGLARLSLHEQLLGGLHLIACLREHLGQHAKAGVGGLNGGATQSLEQIVQLLVEPALREVERGDVRAERGGGGLRAIALRLEGTRDDVALALHERPGAHFATLAAAAARLVLLVLAIERANRHELDVARAGLGAVDGVVVARAGVVAHDVSSGEVHLLEEERVRCDHLARAHATRRAASERDHLLGAAIHPIHQFERGHSVVVGRLGFNEHLIDVRGTEVASRLPDAHHGRCVLQRVHDVLDRARDHRAVLGLQLDAIEAVTLHDEPRGERGIIEARERHGGPAIESQAAAAHCTGGVNAQDGGGPGRRGDVAAILGHLRREIHERRESELHADARDPGQVAHREVPTRAAHAARLDEVLGVLGHIEESHDELLRPLAGPHRDALELGAGATADDQFDQFALEPRERRAQLHVAAAGDDQ